MKKNVGIITFQNTWNVGADLQAFALQEVINTKYNNLSAVHIDYINEEVSSHYKVPEFRESFTIKKMIKYIMARKKLYQKKVKFESFSKGFISQTKPYTAKTVRELNNEFDIFITGSDQVFNPILTKGDKNYLLNFVDENKKRFSYAGSFGKTEYFKNNPSFFYDDFRKFDVLSLREDDIVNLLSEKYPELPVEKVLDPTFLLTKEEWIDRFPIIKDSPSNSKYILIYTVNPGEKLISYAQKMAKEHKLEIIFLNNGWKPVVGVKNIYDFGPIEFLRYIYNSDFVLATSFHGLAFSIQFEKQFGVEMMHGTSTGAARLESILREFQINNRSISDDLIIFSEKIDYKKVNSLLSNSRKKSLSVLSKIVQEDLNCNE